MKLQEFQLKHYFKQYGIPIPEGYVTSVTREVRQIAEEIGDTVVVKAQVLAEGRGMSGGIRLAKNPHEAEVTASEILSSHINGLPVRKVLVDEAISIEKEYFLLITFDRATKLPLLMMYDSGSIYIETAANALFENLERVYIDPLVGLQRYQIRDLAGGLNFPIKYLRNLTEICMSMWRLFEDMDARIVAINPLAITKDNRLLALDGKIVLDDNAEFRRDFILDMRDLDTVDEGEFEAHKYGMDYIKLDGDIGCLMNGAGLTMATIDYLISRGGHPANFLDIGSRPEKKTVASALNIILSDPQVKVVLVNICGGMTHCDIVADGLIYAIDQCERDVPIVVHFRGTMAEAGMQKIKGQRLISVSSTPEAVSKVLGILDGMS